MAANHRRHRIGRPLAQKNERSGRHIHSISIALIQSQRHAELSGCAGIDHWIVNPLMRVGRDRKGGVIGDRMTILYDMLHLHEASKKAGIRFTLDDEFDCLQHKQASADHPELKELPVRVLPKHVQIFRLNAAGECTFGIDILQQQRPSTPRWRPDTDHAATFLSRLQTASAA